MNIRYMQTGSLSRDLLEERARAVIGFADPRDYVVRVSTQRAAETPVAAPAGVTVS